MKMNCRECIDFLMAYLDNELPESERAVFEDHLAKCPPCVDYLNTYRATIELEKKACCCKDAPPPAVVPEDLIKAILAARKAGGCCGDS